MDAANSSQEDNWQNNIYILSTTRVFMVLGLTYLIKISYQLYKTTRASDDSTLVSNRSTYVFFFVLYLDTKIIR